MMTLMLPSTTAVKQYSPLSNKTGTSTSVRPSRLKEEAPKGEEHILVKLLSIDPEGKEGRDGLANYMQIKDVRILLTLACVNKQFNEIFSHPAFWQALPHAFNSKVEAKAAWIECVNEGLMQHSKYGFYPIKLGKVMGKNYLRDFFLSNNATKIKLLKMHIRGDADVIKETPPTPLNKKAISSTAEGDASLCFPHMKFCQLF